MIWLEAALTTTHLINRLLSRVLGFKSPMEVLSNFLPTYNPSTRLVLKIFGCASFVHVHSNARGKLDPREIKCVFIGYSSTQKGYKCYFPDTREIFVTTDVTFFENESYFRPSL